MVMPPAFVNICRWFRSTMLPNGLLVRKKTFMWKRQSVFGFFLNIEAVRFVDIFKELRFGEG